MLSNKITSHYGEEMTDLLLHMIDYTPDGLVTVGEDHQIMVFNTGAERIFGYSPEEALDQDVGMLLPVTLRSAIHEQLDNFRKTHSAVCDKSNIPASIVITILGLNNQGKEFPCEATLTKIRFKEHEYVIIAIEDITKRLQEEKKKAAQKINRRAELILQVTEDD